ncbi:hypothetical protein HRI_003386700 [Hibiscus trionum]|uniref:Protein PSY3-like n=1 Tax=Hibiscus trionum TaxID=183268 RepID=A0A9W7MEF9_HIBTR|nr:hypothetical protein HRI_003386700 [Hibiscus trionum]
MGFGVKLCILLLFSLSIFSSARNTISLSVDEIVLAAEGRSLTARMEDYDEPAANPGHDPPSRARSSGGNGGGRRG